MILDASGQLDGDGQEGDEEDDEGEIIGVFIEDKEESEDEAVSNGDAMNVKRGSDGQPLPTNARSNSVPPTQIQDLLNKGSERLVSKPKTKRNPATKNKSVKT